MKDYEKLSQLAEVLVGYNKKEQLMMFSWRVQKILETKSQNFPVGRLSGRYA